MGDVRIQAGVNDTDVQRDYLHTVLECSFVCLTLSPRETLGGLTEVVMTFSTRVGAGSQVSA